MAEPDLVIRSRSNPLLKRVGAALAGKLEDTLVLEGERLVRDAVRAGCELELLLLSEGREVSGLEGHAAQVRRVEDTLLDRVSALASSPGILALCGTPSTRSLARLEVDPRTLLLVVAGIADPGNLGALARSAEAAGCAALVVLPGGASPWNEKALRGSMGSLLRLPVVLADSVEAVLGRFEELGIRQITAATRGGRDLRRFDWSGPLALWIGSETRHLPAACAGLEGVSIPMAGAAESLNVTVAASVLLFAAERTPTTEEDPEP